MAFVAVQSVGATSVVAAFVVDAETFGAVASTVGDVAAVVGDVAAAVAAGNLWVGRCPVEGQAAEVV